MYKSITADMNTTPIEHRIEKVFGQFLLIVRDKYGAYHAGRFDTREAAKIFFQRHIAKGDLS